MHTFQLPIRRTQATVLIALLTVMLLLVLFRDPLGTHTRTLLLLSEQLPQIPLKPLSLLTTEPTHRQLRLDSRHGPIVADLYVPTRRFGQIPPESQPGVILALGVHMPERDRPLLRHLAGTLARLGFVVLWPRLEAVDTGRPLAEQPDTFVAGIRYLDSLANVDPQRISLLGFSMGASTALVAAGDPQVAHLTHAVVFFGGYYDLSEYLLSVATRSVELDSQLTPWHPPDWVVQQVRDLLQEQDLSGTARVFEAATRPEAQQRLGSISTSERAVLRSLNPSEHIHQVSAQVFILHDRADPIVPPVESVKLRRAMPDERVGAFLLTGLFEHAQPQQGMSREAIGESLSLYGFVYRALGHL